MFLSLEGEQVWKYVKHDWTAFSCLGITFLCPCYWNLHREMEFLDHLCKRRLFSRFSFFIWFVSLLALAATPGLLCQPRVRVKMIVEKQMECKLAEKPKFQWI
jgi:hypothetical protein